MSEDVLDNIARVPIPNVVPHGFPLWGTGHFRRGTLILQGNALPLNIAHRDCVDLAMKIPVVGDGRGVAMGNERGSPQFKKVVNLSSRKFSVRKHELREFKPGSGREGGPIVIGFGGWCFWWNIRWDKLSMFITPQACEALG